MEESTGYSLRTVAATDASSGVRSFPACEELVNRVFSTTG
jgi:hypothetical protein